MTLTAKEIISQGNALNLVGYFVAFKQLAVL